MAGWLLAVLVGWGALVAATTWRTPAPATATAPAHECSAACVADTASESVAEQPVAPQGPVVFTHADHVARTWFAPGTAEVWRDCRGCHRFDATNAASAPQRYCDDCHGAGNLAKDFAPGWQQDLSPYVSRTRDAFRHFTHSMLECRECHLRPGRRDPLRDFDIFTGPGQCARCHAAGAAAAPGQDGKPFALLRSLRWFAGAADPEIAKTLGVAPWQPPTEARFADYAAKLHTVFAGASGGLNTQQLPIGGTFDHADHGQIGCTDCHVNVPNAGPRDVGTGQIPDRGCGACHTTGAEQKPARPAPAKAAVSAPLHALGTFAHADHLRFRAQRAGVPDVVAPGVRETLTRERACAVCHVQDPKGIGQPQADFPFDTTNSKNRYLDCVGCHDVAGWRTGEGKDGPYRLHDSTDGQGGDGPGGQGNGGWAECARCHVFGAKDFARARPRESVQRFSGATFEFRVHTHKYIAGKAVTDGELQDCKQCHRARPPELPSRIERKQFRHRTHLPAEPSVADCRGCHPTAGTAADVAALSDNFRTYTTSTCATCHRGGPVVEVDSGAPPAARDVPTFPHGPHVAGGVACATCHTLATDGADMTTTPAAAACNECHDHVKGTKLHEPVAERLFGDEVRSCAQCHRAEPAAAGGAAANAPPALALPAIRGTPAAATDPRYRVDRVEFGGFVDPQFHPLDRACDECHKANLSPDLRKEGWFGRRVPRDDHLKLRERGRSFHAGQAQRPAECLQCHWSGTTKGLSTTRPTDELERMRAEPGGAEARQRFGNDFTDYPGPKSKG